MLPVLRANLLEQAVKITDARFGGVLLKVAPITGCPSPLVGMMLSEAAKRWLQVRIRFGAVEEGEQPLDLS
ncbi:hypothetical protein [Bradyrhizobium forestalis]|uniref:hypothetical protein n=1 Tax=Bradyrhizobium forestalis TaxID=1419263 RepID=UPI00130402A1|nr:hypothetical protein [Bradyrhizobium forestalis]